jgi:hypothetical protein
MMAREDSRFFHCRACGMSFEAAHIVNGYCNDCAEEILSLQSWALEHGRYPAPPVSRLLMALKRARDQLAPRPASDRRRHLG